MTEARAPLERGDLPPEIRVAPPGPASRALSADLARYEAPGISTLGPGDAPAVVWREALGANVVDVDGNRYIDLTAGFGVAALGHRPPAVVAAVARQAGELLHGLGDVAAHPARVELAGRLAALAPVDTPRVHFAVSGADAVEIAIKSALAHGHAAGRRALVVFDPSYHGTTLGALAATSRPAFREPFAEHLTPHVVRFPFGGALEALATALANAAAVIVEPVVGREGVLVPPEGWLAELATRTRDAGALLVADEIFTGFGRTGERFAVDADGVRPDLLCLGKALGGGLPIAAVVGRAELLEVWRTSGEALHTGTFVAHPLACAAALAALDEMERLDLPCRARKIGARIRARLAAPAAAVNAALRSRGALAGLAFPDAPRAKELAAALLARGVLVLAGGAHGDVVQIAPPLTIDLDQLDCALARLVEALAAVNG